MTWVQTINVSAVTLGLPLPTIWPIWISLTARGVELFAMEPSTFEEFVAEIEVGGGLNGGAKRVTLLI
ncbi:hypothetical protein [Pseudomonas aeruginosa]|uniref:hypothetical protein n=1 Tax=Pseudomonas aeruginosa TaxID=287 RepID=UPI00265AF460|nr:hypothetical protein [Pseudomonas aeruginosa]